MNRPNVPTQSSSRPRTLIWSLVAILAILIVAIGAVLAASLVDWSEDSSASTFTTTITPPPPVIETVTEQAPVPQPVVPPVQETTVEAPAAPAPASGEMCSTPGYTAFDDEGTEFVCQYLGAGGGYRWVFIAPSSGPGELGGPCDPATQATARTPDGQALLCSPGPNGEPGIWMDGP